MFQNKPKKNKLEQKKIYNCIVKIIPTHIVLDPLIPYNIIQQSKSIGAGFFIDNDGHILTCAHVVKNIIEIWITLPETGKNIFRADIICVYPDFDLAIIKIRDHKNKFFLNLGNSENINLGDEIYALGYPDNSEYPMRTTGTISGRRGDNIQTDVALNPGNSGGPCLNEFNHVIGVSSAVIAGSEDSSLIVPINAFKNVIDSMINSGKKIIYKNVLGILLVNGNDNYKEMYNVNISNIKGQIIKKILKGSPFKKFAKEGDILHSIDNYNIDYYGEISVEWEDAKVPLEYIVKRKKPFSKMGISIYSLDKKKIISNKITLKTFPDIYPIRQVFPHVEKIDYEVFAGLVVMNLNLDHIIQNFHHLIHLIVNEEIYEPYIIISHIFKNSKIGEYNTINTGSLLDKVNNIKVRTLTQYREAMKKYISKNNKNYIVMETLNRDKVILNLDEVIEYEKKLISQYGYSTSISYNFYNKEK